MSKPKVIQETIALGDGKTITIETGVLAKQADGWFAPTDNAASLAPMLEPLKASCAEFGRDYDSIEITSMWNNQGGLDAIKAFADIGVSRVIVPVFALEGDPVSGLTRLGDEIISRI